MTYTQEDLNKIHWQCRRGMKEMDMLVNPYFHHQFQHIDPELQTAFLKLLTFPDDTLFNWFLKDAPCPEPDLIPLIKTIKAFSREHYNNDSV